MPLPKIQCNFGNKIHLHKQSFDYFCKCKFSQAVLLKCSLSSHKYCLEQCKCKSSRPLVVRLVFLWKIMMHWDLVQISTQWILFLLQLFERFFWTLIFLLVFFFKSLIRFDRTEYFSITLPIVHHVSFGHSQSVSLLIRLGFF